MPKDLGDVFDYFLPPAEAKPPRRRLRALGEPTHRTDHPAALPIVALPVGERDVLRAALAWNLTVEVARQGASGTLLAPASEGPSAVWPEAGPGPVGSEVVHTPAENLSELSRAALDVAVARAADAGEGLVLVGVPPEWLGDGEDGRALLRWVLLLASTERGDLLEAYRIAKRVARTAPDGRLGLTIHGARRITEAEHAFRHMAGVASRHLGRQVESYGFLVDDLQVYRAVVARRPIGLEHPQARATRALHDVARMLLEDARAFAVA